MFQQLELDYTIAPTHPVAKLDLKEAPVIRMCAAWLALASHVSLA